MSNHYFDDSLASEQEQFAKADQFYNNFYRPNSIKRYKFENEEEKSFQQSDIDLTLSFDNSKIDISEKFRLQYYNDLLLEIYSAYDSKPGWAFDSKANELFYFIIPKNKVIIIKDMQAIVKFFNSTLYPSIPKSVFSDIMKINGSGKLPGSVRLNNKKIYQVMFVKAHNIQNTPYDTISIAIPFSMLSDNNIKLVIKDII